MNGPPHAPTPPDSLPHAAGPPAEVVAFTVAASSTERLDRFLADQLALSRTQAARLIADGAVSVNDAPGRAGRPLARGDRVVVRRLPVAAPVRELVPWHVPLAVVHEDEDVLVLDKPAGMVVHPAVGNRRGTLVNAILHAYPRAEWPGARETSSTHLTNARPYKPAWSTDEALSFLAVRAPDKFDAECVAAVAAGRAEVEEIRARYREP